MLEDKELVAELPLDIDWDEDDDRALADWLELPNADDTTELVRDEKLGPAGVLEDIALDEALEVAEVAEDVPLERNLELRELDRDTKEDVRWLLDNDELKREDELNLPLSEVEVATKLDCAEEARLVVRFEKLTVGNAWLEWRTMFGCENGIDADEPQIGPAGVDEARSGLGSALMLLLGRGPPPYEPLP